jgi:ELWxxDGT repeat protein
MRTLFIVVSYMVVMSGLAANSGSSPRDLVTSGSFAYFTAAETTNSLGLFRTDGTASGTVKITGKGLEFGMSKGMFLADGKLYYRSTGNPNSSSSDQMMRCDGTDAGTTQIALRAGWTDSLGEQYAWYKRPRFLRAGNVVYFGAQSTPFSTLQTQGQVFRVGLDDQVTTRLRNVNLYSGVNGLIYGAVVGNTLYFDYCTSGSGPAALYKTDGTDAGTTGVCTLPSGSNPSFDIWRLPDSNDMVLGVATPQYNRELWRTDGTDSGTTLVKDINPSVPLSSFDSPGNGSSQPQFFADFAGYVYFTACSSSITTSRELWRTDGTTSGTTRVTTKIGGDFSILSAAELNGNLIFAAASNNDMELWKTDGTDAGTTLVKDINPTGSSYAQHFMLLPSNELLFIATGKNGQELWKTDGTSGGTVEVKDIYPGPTDSRIMEFCQLPDGVVLFRADDGQHGSELWRTDGTTAGTYLVTDLNTAPAFSSISNWQSY